MCFDVVFATRGEGAEITVVQLPLMFRLNMHPQCAQYLNKVVQLPLVFRLNMHPQCTQHLNTVVQIPLMFFLNIIRSVLST